MGQKNKATRQNANRKVVNGITKHLRGTVTLEGASYTPEGLAEVFQDVIELADAADRSANAWHVAVAKERKGTRELSGVHTSLRNYVSAIFGEAGSEFADFGFVPRAVTAVDVATKADAVVKRAATRAARGTRGKRQKEQIKGTTVASAAPADPAVTAPAAAPAASAPAATNGAPTGASSSNGVAGSP